jgi:hypothetical protein
MISGKIQINAEYSWELMSTNTVIIHSFSSEEYRNASIMKIEAVFSYETLVISYQIIRCHMIIMIFNVY